LPAHIDAITEAPSSISFPARRPPRGAGERLLARALVAQRLSDGGVRDQLQDRAQIARLLGRRSASGMPLPIQGSVV